MQDFLISKIGVFIHRKKQLFVSFNNNYNNTLSSNNNNKRDGSE